MSSVVNKSALLALCFFVATAALLLFWQTGNEAPPPHQLVDFPFFKTKSPTARPTPSSIPGTPALVPHDTDCMVRASAHAFALRIVDKKHGKLIYDALALASCGIPMSLPIGESAMRAERSLQDDFGASVLILYCDAQRGRDSNNGSKDKPLKTLAEAIKRVGNVRASKSQIILREGVYYSQRPNVLGKAHAGLTIRAHAQERVVISGALHPRIKKSSWKRISNSKKRNEDGSVVWRTVLSPDLEITNVEALRLGGARLVRARTPNGHPEQSQHDSSRSSWFKSERVEWIKPAQTSREPDNVFVESSPKDWPSVKWLDGPANAAASNEYDHVPGMGGMGSFALGRNCPRLKPRFGYFCTVRNRLGARESSFRAPLGASKLPVSEGTLLVAWAPNRTHTWTFQIDSWQNRNTALFKESTLGIQAARGADFAQEFYVENSFSALDQAGEFYFDAQTRELFVCLNATHPLTGLEDWAIVAGRELLRIEPGAKNIALQGIEFRDTLPTWLDAHGTTAGGDWTLPSTAAITTLGVDGLRIANCTFSHLDGSALLLHGYARNVVVEDSEFAWLGASAILSIGTTSPCLNAWCTRRLDVGVNGPDGRGGAQPRGTVVRRNVFRELGVFVKQSAAYFSALSGQAKLTGNVMFNLPQSAIILQDGFLGGDWIARNLIFNTGKEASGNSSAGIDMTDRMPFIWEGGSPAGSGGATTVPLTRTIQQNFILANYDSASAVATRDGASEIAILGNVLVYGDVGLKSSRGGHALVARNNLLLHVQNACFLPKHADAGKLELKMEFANNTCLLTNTALGYGSSCALGSITVRDNSVSTLFAGPMRIQCDGEEQWLAEYLQAHAEEDANSREIVEGFPRNEQLARWINQWMMA